MRISAFVGITTLLIVVGFCTVPAVAGPILFNAFFDNVELSTVPEPTSAWLGLGILAIAGIAHRRRRIRGVGPR